MATKHTKEDIRGKGAHLGVARVKGGEHLDGLVIQPHGGCTAVRKYRSPVSGIRGRMAESKGPSFVGADDPTIGGMGYWVEF